MKRGITVRDRYGNDKIEIVWLWIPRTLLVLESDPVFPYKSRYLKPNHKAWRCWAVKRTGTFIGTIYEPVRTLNVEGSEWIE